MSRLAALLLALLLAWAAPAWAAVAHDATVAETTGTADPTDLSYTPTGTPRGAVVLIVHGTTSTDIVVGVTYGGVAMTRVQTASDTADEPGRSYVYFLGSSIPTSTQTISVDRNESTTTIHVVVATVTATTDTEVVDSDASSENTVDPSLTLSYGGRTCISYGIAYSGFAVVSQLAPNASMSAVLDHDYGNFISRADRQTTPGTSDFTMSYTSSGGTSEDNAFVALAISEVSAPAASVAPQLPLLGVGN